MARRLPAQAPVLSGLRFVRPLGTGGFADVYLFEQDMPRRSVAVKVLLADVVDADTLRMFNAEADVMARLSAHPSILTVHQASISADGRPYLVMEYCPTSLTNRYRREQIPFDVHVVSVQHTANLVPMLDGQMPTDRGPNWQTYGGGPANPVDAHSVSAYRDTVTAIDNQQGDVITNGFSEFLQPPENYESYQYEWAE